MASSIRSIPKKWIYVGFVSLPILAWAMFWIHATYGVSRISDKKLHTAWKTGKIWGVVDVRTNTEWNQGHFLDAVHVPVQDIREEHPVINSLRLESERIWRERTDDERRCLLVYCRTGNRARYAVEKMREFMPKHTCIIYTTLTYEEIERLVGVGV